MKIFPIFFEESYSNYSYILQGDRTVCIDPFDGARIIKDFPEMKFEFVVNTHQHFDHIQGNDDLIREGAQIFEGCDIDMGNGDRLELIKTPGHTKEHIGVIHYHGEKMCSFFSGDTIFSGGVGNCKNGGDPAVLFSTVSMLVNSLRDDVTLYPGHDYRKTNLEFAKSLGLGGQESENKFTTIGEEKGFNPFLRVWDPNFLKIAFNRGVIDKEESKQAFLKLRELRNNW